MSNLIIKNILSLQNIKGIGPAFFKKRLNIFYDIDNFQQNFYKSLSDKEKNKINIEEYYNLAEEIIQKCNEYSIKIISFVDEQYPKKLLELKDPPPILYLKGNYDLLNKKIIGIIGTRKATDLGKKIALRIGLFFSKDYSICNGLVDGIDKFAIGNENVYKNVIGILSGGLNFDYTSNKITKELSNNVLTNNGLLISEYPPNKKEDAFSGSKASRIQAGLSDCLILVESSLDGGSKYTVKPFVELNNRLLCVINFNKNIFFNKNDSFSANRCIVNGGKEAIAQFCQNDKLAEKIKCNILSIEDSKKYEDIIKRLNMNLKISNSLF